jgi:transcription elongation factor Elf1
MELATLTRRRPCPLCGHPMLVTAHHEEEDLTEFIVVTIVVLADCTNCSVQIKTRVPALFQKPV